MRNALRSIFTDGTNEDMDYAKVLSALSLLVFMGACLYGQIAHAEKFQATEFAFGIATIIGVGTGAAKLKDWTVPPAKENKEGKDA